MLKKMDEVTWNMINANKNAKFMEIERKHNSVWGITERFMEKMEFEQDLENWIMGDGDGRKF